MFNEPGDKLKATATVLFWLGVIGSIVPFFLIGFTFLSVVYCIAGCLVSYISSLVLYAFGDAIYDISVIRSDMRNTNKLLSDAISNLTKDEKRTTSQSHERRHERREVDNSDSGLASRGLVRCPFCGTVQSNVRDDCYQCQSKLPK